MQQPTPLEEFGALLTELIKNNIRPSGYKGLAKVWSIAQLTDALQVDATALGRWRRGEVMPKISLDELEKLFLGPPSLPEDLERASLRQRLKELYRAAEKFKVEERKKKKPQVKPSDADKLETVHRLVREKALNEYIDSKQERLGKTREGIEHEITSLLKTNARIRHPDALDWHPLEAFWHGLLVFFEENEHLYSDDSLYDACNKTANRLDVLAQTKLNRRFSHQQWVFADVAYEKVKRFQTIISEVGEYAASIDASDEFQKWAQALPTRWHDEARRYLEIVKPRIDEIRMSRSDPGAKIMRTEKAHRVEDDPPS